jgi:hypothetical protein
MSETKPTFATAYPLREVEKYESVQGMMYMTMKGCGHRLWAGFTRQPSRRCTACPIRPEVRAAFATPTALACTDSGR